MAQARHVVRMKQPKLSLGAQGPRGAREGMEGGPGLGEEKKGEEKREERRKKKEKERKNEKE